MFCGTLKMVLENDLHIASSNVVSSNLKACVLCLYLMKFMEKPTIAGNLQLI